MINSANVNELSGGLVLKPAFYNPVAPGQLAVCGTYVKISICLLLVLT